MSKNNLQSAQESINEIEEALNSISQKQQNEDAFVDKANITIIGISFGGSLLLKATLDAKIKSNPPRSMLMYGSCFDLESGLNFLLTGEISNQGVQYKITPHEWGLIVFFQNYLTRPLGFFCQEK